MERTDAKSNLERELNEKTDGLFRLVALLNSPKWACDGKLLKDSEEWVRFYIAYKALSKYRG